MLEADGGYRLWHNKPDDDQGLAAAQKNGLALQLGIWYSQRIEQRELARTCDELRQGLNRWRS